MASVDALGGKNLALAGAHIGGADKDFGHVGQACGGVQLLKIDGALQQHAQGVDVQRIGLVGGEELAHQPQQRVVGHAGGKKAHRAHPFPQLAQSRARAFAGRFVAGFGMLGKLQRSAGKAVGQGHRIHRASAGAADAGKFDAPIFQQCIKHAPGKRAVRAPALQGEVEVANLRGAWVCGHSRIVIP